MSDPGSYRPNVEVQAFKDEDPVTVVLEESIPDYPSESQLDAVGRDNIAHLTGHMRREGYLDREDVERMKQEVADIVDEAVSFATNSPEPDIRAAWRALYSNRGQEVLI